MVTLNELFARRENDLPELKAVAVPRPEDKA